MKCKDIYGGRLYYLQSATKHLRYGQKLLRKASGRSERVVVYTYSLGSAAAWWAQNSGTYSRFKNLSVIHLYAEDIDSVRERSMRLQCNISDGELSMHSDKGDVYVKQERWQ